MLYIKLFFLKRNQEVTISVEIKSVIQDLQKKSANQAKTFVFEVCLILKVCVTF